MSLVVSQAGPSGRAGEMAVWGFAGLAMLAAHLGAALLMMQATPSAPPEGAPPAAIMIELAPQPEAAHTQEEQLAADMQDQQAVQSEQAQPVQDPPPPVEQPRPEPQAEPVPPEPMVDPAHQPQPEPAPPEPEMTQTIPEPQPEPVVPPEPVPQAAPEPMQEQPTAAMETVDVPLPMMRPPPPPVAEKPKDAKPKEPVRRHKPKPQPQQQQARQEKAEARIEAKETNRTAASQNSAGVFSSSVSPARWKSQVQAKVARNANRCPAGGLGSATVRFSFDGSGNVTNVSLLRSSGNTAIDGYIVSAVRRASPIPTPPPGAARFFDQLLACH